jgi:hypothetical protein
MVVWWSPDEEALRSEIAQLYVILAGYHSTAGRISRNRQFTQHHQKELWIEAYEQSKENRTDTYIEQNMKDHPSGHNIARRYHIHII